MGSLFGIPIALLSSLASGIVGFIGKRSAHAMEVAAAKDKHQLDLMLAVTEANKATTEMDIQLLEARGKYAKDIAKADPHASVARRNIAYFVIIAISFVVPALVLFGDLSWFTIETWIEKSNGFFGLGATTKTIVEVVQAYGLPLVWLEGMFILATSVIGYYMGVSSARIKSPYCGK